MNNLLICSFLRNTFLLYNGSSAKENALDIVGTLYDGCNLPIIYRCRSSLCRLNILIFLYLWTTYLIITYLPVRILFNDSQTSSDEPKLCFYIINHYHGRSFQLCNL